MALTNAERQARYRARLKARASAAGLMVHVDKVVDDAVDALWSYFNRPDPDGQPWADIDGCAAASDYRATIAGQLTDISRAVHWNGQGLLPDEEEALAKLIALADSIDLRRAAA